MPDCKHFLLAFTLLTASLIAIGQSNHNLHFDSGYAEVNGTKLYYEIAGAGQPLILIHAVLEIGGSGIYNSLNCRRKIK